MRLVSVEHLEVGSILAQDVHTSQGGLPLLRHGVTISERYQRALSDNGVRSVWVEDELSEGIVPHTPISDETRSKTTSAVGNALAEAKEAMGKGKGLSDNALADLADVADLITQEVQNAPDVAMHLADMMGADQYLLQHVVDVTALGVVLARRHFQAHGWIDFTGRKRFDGIESRLSKIGMGLLLHDIGKLTIPQNVLNKPGKLDDAEWQLMKRHPEMGIEMLGPDASFLVKAVVRSHHERFDGRGYPDGLSGTGIHQFARIASVADVYDAVTSARSYKEAAPPHVGVDIILNGAGTAFDPDVVATFQKTVMPYPPGYEVLLVDGRRAVVVHVDLDAPHNPHVRIRNDDGTVEEIVRADLADDGADDGRLAA